MNKHTEPKPATLTALQKRKQELEILIPAYQDQKRYNEANELILEYKEVCKNIENIVVDKVKILIE